MIPVSSHYSTIIYSSQVIYNLMIHLAISLITQYCVLSLFEYVILVAKMKAN